ncbi:MAG: hypothetical protein NTZ84_00200 [Candidatus Nealsonbacteria bacterium]|nr:hypothetical protein [Candidatus Nealsonbacteria bacterium]
MTVSKNSKIAKAWVVAVNMGYGHQRTAFPLRSLAPDGKIINANDYQGIPNKDKIAWEGTRKVYEFISNLKKFFLVGEFVFFIFNQFQKIFSFYPKRDLSRTNFQLREIFSLIKNGWGKHLIEKLKKNPLPFVSTFLTQAFMAEFFNYPADIFCVICDADIARPWAPINPKKSRIKYFVPTERAMERLKLYGVKQENIFLTGYPLPLENIGTENMDILKQDLSYRLLNLDRSGKYSYQYQSLIQKYLGKMPKSPDHPLTVMFSVGGAGAQKEIGVKILKNMTDKIKKGEIKIILVAGVKEKIKEYFEKNINKLGLEKNSNIEIVYAPKIEDYFLEFNKKLRKTDILWTKPSELSFYSALGIPIIVAPPVGSQEDFNQRWLLKSGFGIMQENPDYVSQWFFDWLESGYFAEAAMEGFIEGKKLGTFNIEKIICGL